MKNRDLIAFLKPLLNQFSEPGCVELIDVIGQVTDIRADRARLAIRLSLPAGIYQGRFETVPHAFDMSTAMIDMVRAPDGQRVPVGPWDLDHLHNVMAMPMARVWVNGRLKGGLWCAMPGPTQIAQGRLAAEFGFEAQEGDTELVLEWIERDRPRIDWASLDFFELRNDDRSRLALEPIAKVHPRIFLSADQAEQVCERWQHQPEFLALQQQLRTQELVFLTDNSQGTLEMASLVYALTGDETIGARALAKIMGLADAGSWSGRPDPLLMGGDNDRGIGLRLYHCALAWEFLQPLLNSDHRRALLSKAEEYLQKIYDFTLLQRAYMGYPSIEPHSLGAWNGAAIACMAFYDELAIARHALPFFHGLFADSLKLFPASGKAAWATYFPFHMVLYLAAAHTFGGVRPELSSSPFLDHLADALLACFEAPNSQEMQRGLRTREHRFLTAFLCRFHPSPRVESIYRAFVHKERAAAGDVVLGLFDLLYAPDLEGPVASFPQRPLIAKDVGDMVAMSRGEQTIAVSVSAGAKAGRRAAFTLMPHNREFAPSMGAIDVTIDGTPVLCNINISQYGLNSALTNTMCFNTGGALTNGQYLNGAIPAESTALLRRYLVDDRFLYAHIVITHALDPSLKINRADRIFIFDRRTGAILLSDMFEASQPVRFATHLHCAGSITDLGNNLYRLTGGQADRIAGIKGGGKGLNDEEKGEIFVRILQTCPASRVVIEEPTWVPGYIYGLNNTGLEEIGEARFPRYLRWRLEAAEQLSHGSFLVGLSPHPNQIEYSANSIVLPHQGSVQFGFKTLHALGAECECECLMCDEPAGRLIAMGLRSFRHHASHMRFASPVDLVYSVSREQGTIYAQGALQPESLVGFALGPWLPIGDEEWKTHQASQAHLIRKQHN